MLKITAGSYIIKLVVAQYRRIQNLDDTLILNWEKCCTQRNELINIFDNR